MATPSSSRPQKRTKTANSQTPAERRASYRMDMMEDMTSKMTKMQSQQASLQTTQSPPTPPISNPWATSNYDLEKLLDPDATPSAFLPDTTNSHYGFPTQQSHQHQGASDQFMMGDFLKSGLTPYENSKHSSEFDSSMWDYFSLDDTHSTQIVAPQDLTSSTSAVPASKVTLQNPLNPVHPPQATLPPQDPTQKVPKKRGRKRKQLDEKTQVEERKKFLERNRVAANRCRERKKTYVSNLEGRQKDVLARNQYLRCELDALREEVAALKQLVHVECACSEEVLEVNLRQKLSGMGQGEADTEELVAKFKRMRTSGDTAGRGMDVLMREIAAASPSSVASSSGQDDLFSLAGDDEEGDEGAAGSGTSADSSPVEDGTDGKSAYPVL